MEQDRITDFFLTHFPDQPELAGFFSLQSSLVQFKKNEIIKKAYKTEGFISIVVSGSAGVFSPGEKRDVCLDISLEGEFFMDFESLLLEAPTNSYTQALEKLVLARIEIPASDSRLQLPGYNEVIKSALSIMFSDRQARLIEVLSEPPLQRYISLWNRSPHLFRNVSSTILASYLGVSREHFSRIKTEFLKRI